MPTTRIVPRVLRGAAQPGTLLRNRPAYSPPLHRLDHEHAASSLCAAPPSYRVLHSFPSGRTTTPRRRLEDDPPRCRPKTFVDVAGVQRPIRNRNDPFIPGVRSSVGSGLRLALPNSDVPEGQTDDLSAGPGPCNAALEYKSRMGTKPRRNLHLHLGTLDRQAALPQSSVFHRSRRTQNEDEL